MNETIKDQQHRIGTAVNSSFYALERIAGHAAAYKAEKAKIDGYTDYTEAARQSMTDRAAATYGNAVAPEIVKLTEQAGIIRDALAVMESTLDTGAELQNALNVAKLGKALPSAVRFNLFEQFRGQPQQIAVLSAAFEAVDIDPSPYMVPISFTADQIGKKLDSAIDAVSAAKAGETFQAWQLSRNLEKMGDRVGADTPRRASELDGLSGGLDEAIRWAVLGK